MTTAMAMGDVDMKPAVNNVMLAIMLVALTGSTTTCGGGNGVTASKYTAEERGYLSQFEPALRAICTVGTTIQRENGLTMAPGMCGTDGSGQPQFCMTPVPDYEDVNVQRLSDGYANASQFSQQIESSLPPSSMSHIHRQVLTALQTERAAGPNVSIPQMRNACSLYNGFVRSVGARTVSLDRNDSVYLSFSPSIGPTVTYDSTEGFTVEQSFSVPVPYGGITAGYRESRGVHALHIVFEGRRRVFILDRPFEFYLPRGYATRVSYRGGDEIVLFVERG